jgi:cyclopropane fatty-acyl-phospholipid synthase-like methyltransferase
MNTVPQYSYEYYYKNYLRYPRFIMRWYYGYLARWCIAKPAHLVIGGKILDIGCGAGFLTHALRTTGFDALGVDVSPAAIEHSVDPAHCRLVNTTASLDYHDNEFDAIVSREVLEHIPPDEIDSCIKEWDRVGTGTMVHFVAVQERGKSATDDPTHMNIQPEKWWHDKFRHFGYTIVRRPNKMNFSLRGPAGYFIAEKSKN